MTETRAEVAILGGGSAGLSAALTLARARRSVVVIDSNDPRNAAAARAHGLLGREGVHPLDLLATGREEASSFGAEIRSARALSVETDKRGFRVNLDDNETVAARALIVATGVRDEFPQIEGLITRWGRDVVHCPYCHGWEIRDKRIGLIATNPMSALQALLFHQWSKRVRFFTQGLEFSDSDLRGLAAVGIPVTNQPVTRLIVDDDTIVGVTLDDGARIDVDVIALPTRTVARLDGLQGLGLKSVESPMGVSLVVDAAGHTSVPGIWGAGNVVNGGQQISEAAANGARVAMTLNTELVFEDARMALDSAQTIMKEKTA